ncbi:substrate-binding and VWA domain-containing protein [Spirillospora albida]|uniref:substrate-binding and VWA domain-containing protein n=1 Tax=Spirillospora albida TaxID=58123 RepID=UPI000AD25B8B|nr:substrate-binding and VWA domain-containing protein [Spirillospora albida]
MRIIWRAVLLLVGYAVITVFIGVVSSDLGDQRGAGLVLVLSFTLVLTTLTTLLGWALQRQLDRIEGRELRDWWESVRALGAALRDGARLRRGRLLVPLLVGTLVVQLGGLAVYLAALSAVDDECVGRKVTIRVASSQGKDHVLRELARKYDGRQIGDLCGHVVIDTLNSGKAVQALADGWTTSSHGVRPDVWSPVSSIWITLYRQQVSKRGEPGPVPEGNQPAIVTSPLSIAMPEPMARALGWPEKGIGWKDVADLARDPRGWGARGHPEWGRFQLGKTNPNFSTSGLNATLAAYFAATGNTSDMTVADIARPQVRDFVKTVERSVVHYGNIAETFMENLRRADERGQAMAYISAVAAEERSVIDYNRGNPAGDPAGYGKRPRPRTRLIALYPNEGTYSSDHPYVQLGWMDNDRKAVAADFLRYLRSPASQAVFQRYGYRDHQGRPGPLSVPEYGVSTDRPISMLNQFSPAVVDAVLKSWSELRKRANVLLVIDKSGSMDANVAGTGKSRLILAKEAALNSLGQFRPDDSVGLWSFSSHLDGDRDHRELVPPGPLSRTGPKLRKEIDALTAGGGTGLYNTAAAAFDRMRTTQSPDAINAVVFLTDGKNERSQPSLTLPNLLARLDRPRSESVRVFTVGYGEEADQSVLTQISEQTEARSYDARDPRHIDDIFADVISNF